MYIKEIIDNVELTVEEETVVDEKKVQAAKDKLAKGGIKILSTDEQERLHSAKQIAEGIILIEEGLAKESAPQPSTMHTEQ